MYLQTPSAPLSIFIKLLLVCLSNTIKSFSCLMKYVMSSTCLAQQWNRHCWLAASVLCIWICSSNELWTVQITSWLQILCLHSPRPFSYLWFQLLPHFTDVDFLSFHEPFITNKCIRFLCWGILHKWRSTNTTRQEHFVHSLCFLCTLKKINETIYNCCKKFFYK